MKFMPRHRGQIAVLNDTIHEWVCLSVTEKNDRAMYFPNAPSNTHKNHEQSVNKTDTNMTVLHTKGV